MTTDQLKDKFRGWGKARSLILKQPKEMMGVLSTLIAGVAVIHPNLTEDEVLEIVKIAIKDVRL